MFDKKNFKIQSYTAILASALSAFILDFNSNW